MTAFIQIYYYLIILFVKKTIYYISHSVSNTVWSREIGSSMPN
jgi:hypothetical protein